MFFKCNFCNSSNLILIWKGFPRVSNLKKFLKKKTDAYRCGNCKSIKLDHFKNYNIANFIDGTYRKETVSSSEQKLSIYKEKKQFLNQINKYLYNKNILDFGCGDSELLKLLSNTNKKLVGLDLNKEFHYKEKKILVTDSFKKSDKFIKKFDAIVSFSVIGMIENPINLLKKFTKRLHKNGIIIIGDINSEDILVDYGKKNMKRFFID